MITNNALFLLTQFGRVEDFRVINTLHKKCRNKLSESITRTQIAKELQLGRKQINHTIQRLVKAGAVIEKVRVGFFRSYQPNPNFIGVSHACVKGTGKKVTC